MANSAVESIGPTVGGKTERVTDIPILTSGGTDNFRSMHSILRTLEDQGNFFEAAMLVDAMMRDDRIFGCSQTRINGLLGTELEFEAADERPESQQALELVDGNDSTPGVFGQIFTPAVVADLLFWGRWLGIGVAEIIWDTTGEHATPRLKIWHPQFIQWDWGTRSYWINTEQGRVELPRTDRDVHSDGNWVIFTPYGFQYAWLKGLVRPVGRLYLGRGWAIRDWMRSSEKNGMAVDLVYIPETAPAEEGDAFFKKVSRRNAETAIKVKHGDTPGLSYDVKLLEATARNWEVFERLNMRLNTDIAVCILGQSETTEATPGLGTGKDRGEAVRGDYKASDARALEYVMYHQVLTWWSKHNFGDPGVAPRPHYELDPPEDLKAKAESIKVLSEAFVNFLDAGTPVDQAELVEQFDIPLKDASEMPPPAPAPLPTGTPPTPAALKASALAAQIGKRYEDRLAERALLRGGKAMAPMLAAIKNAIDGSTSYAELKQKLLDVYGGADSKAMQKLLERAIIMAKLAGRHDVLEAL